MGRGSSVIGTDGCLLVKAVVGVDEGFYDSISTGINDIGQQISVIA